MIKTVRRSSHYKPLKTANTQIIYVKQFSQGSPDDQRGQVWFKKSKIILSTGRISSIKNTPFNLQFNKVTTTNQRLSSDCRTGSVF